MCKLSCGISGDVFYASSNDGCLVQNIGNQDILPESCYLGFLLGIGYVVM